MADKYEVERAVQEYLKKNGGTYLKFAKKALMEQGYTGDELSSAVARMLDKNQLVLESDWTIRLPKEGENVDNGV